MSGIGPRLGAAFAISVILAMVLVGFTTFWLGQDILQEEQQRSLESLQKSFEGKLTDEAQRALGLAEFVANDQTATALFAAGAKAEAGSPARQQAREQLKAQFLATFEPMRRQHGIVQFQYHLPPATSFLRLHKPEKYGDDLSGFRHTVVEVNRTRKPQAGIEVGVAGLGLRGVTPVRHNGQHIGSVEFGLTIGQKFLDIFAQESGGFVAFFYNKDGQFKPEGSTFPTGFSLTRDVLTQGMRSPLTVTGFEVGAQTFSLLLAPARDYSGKAIGVMVLGADQTALLADLDRVRDRSLLIGAGVLLATLLLSWLITRNMISRPLRRLSGSMAKLSQGAYEEEVPFQERHDEIGQIAEAVDILKQHAIARVKQETEEKERQEREHQAAELQISRERIFAQEVGDVVGTIARGELDRRMSVEDKEGLHKELANWINNLATTLDGFIGEMNTVMGGLAQGDLTQRIKQDYEGTFGTLRDNANATSEKLNTIFSRIIETADTITAATHDIASGSGDLSERTEQQAANLEETSATMQELATTVRRNAENADHGRTLATESRQAADNGKQIVSNAVSAMRRIEESSGRIAEIITVIDEIAFQTNLLALNAAVEAARAGDAGKGFAVVAGEVGQLARRSANAAKDIKGLIKESGEQVADGVGLVEKAGSALEEMLVSAGNVADIVSEIAEASSEQATGLDEIAKAVNSMDEMTQQNAALVEENSAATHSLDTQAFKLKEMMAFFLLEGVRLEGQAAMLRHVAITEGGKLDHVNFRDCIMDTLAGKAHVVAERLPDHHCCRLGKWYDSVRDAVVRSNPHFVALEAPHARVHASGKATLEAHERGDTSAAQNQSRELHSASDEVLETLDHLAGDLREEARKL